MIRALYKAREGTPLDDESDLIRRAQDYDSSAFAEIYERYYQGIHNYIYYRVSDDCLAEDLTAEVFLKAMEAIESFTFRGVPLSAWLYRIANNLVIDHFRRQPRHGSVPLEETQVSTRDNPLDVLEHGLTRQSLQRALGELTEEQQQVVILKFVDGLSNNEVAQALGKSEGAIKSLQHRALSSLGRLLGEASENGSGI